ncbi:hypothetical protein D3C76_1227980 [compost metagenome]
MPVGIVDLFEVVHIDDGDHRLAALLPAFMKLHVQQVFPGTVVEQAGQAIGAAQGAEVALVLGKLDGQAIANPAHGQWVEGQHG